MSVDASVAGFSHLRGSSSAARRSRASASVTAPARVPRAEVPQQVGVVGGELDSPPEGGERRGGVPGDDAMVDPHREVSLRKVRRELDRPLDGHARAIGGARVTDQLLRESREHFPETRPGESELRVERHGLFEMGGRFTVHGRSPFAVVGRAAAHVRIVGREVRRRAGADALRVARADRDLQRLCDLRRDAALHLEHVGEIRLVGVLPPRDGRALPRHLDQLGGDENAAGLSRFLPSHRPVSRCDTPSSRAISAGERVVCL